MGRNWAPILYNKHWARVPLAIKATEGSIVSSSTSSMPLKVQVFTTFVTEPHSCCAAALKVFFSLRCRLCYVLSNVTASIFLLDIIVVLGLWLIHTSYQLYTALWVPPSNVQNHPTRVHHNVPMWITNTPDVIGRDQFILLYCSRVTTMPPLLPMI